MWEVPPDLALAHGLAMAVVSGLAAAIALALSFSSIKVSLYFTLQWNSECARADSRDWTLWDPSVLVGASFILLRDVTLVSDTSLC